MDATGFSCTCGRTVIGRWRWCERAVAAGFDTLLVTVDVPVAGARLRDTRNGMSIPPALTLRTVLDAVPHPRWWFDLLTTEPLSFAVAGPLARNRCRVPGHHVRPEL